MSSISQQRFVEALEKLNAEYQLLARDVNMYKTQREEYERKLLLQVAEVQSIKTTIFELECKQNMLQKKYDEELMKFQNSGGKINATAVAPPSDKTEIDLRRLEEKSNGGVPAPKADVIPSLPPVREKMDEVSDSASHVKVENLVKADIVDHPAFVHSKLTIVKCDGTDCCSQQETCRSQCHFIARFASSKRCLLC